MPQDTGGARQLASMSGGIGPQPASVANQVNYSGLNGLSTAGLAGLDTVRLR